MVDTDSIEAAAFLITVALAAVVALTLSDTATGGDSVATLESVLPIIVTYIALEPIYRSAKFLSDQDRLTLHTGILIPHTLTFGLAYLRRRVAHIGIYG